MDVWEIMRLKKLNNELAIVACLIEVTQNIKIKDKLWFLEENWY